MWAYTAGVEVGVAGGRVNGVLFKVFTDVFCGGLREQPVDTLPEEQQGIDITGRFKILQLQRSENYTATT